MSGRGEESTADQRSRRAERRGTFETDLRRVDSEAVETPYGRANAFLHAADDARAALVLGHGAGGGVGSRDLVAVTGVARTLGISVVLVEQPYRVAGRRSPAPAHQLDAAWIAVVEHLRTRRSRAFRCSSVAARRARGSPAGRRV